MQRTAINGGDMRFRGVPVGEGAGDQAGQHEDDQEAGEDRSHGVPPM